MLYSPHPENLNKYHDLSNGWYYAHCFERVKTKQGTTLNEIVLLQRLFPHGLMSIQINRHLLHGTTTSFISYTADGVQPKPDEMVFLSNSNKIWVVMRFINEKYPSNIFSDEMLKLCANALCMPEGDIPADIRGADSTSVVSAAAKQQINNALPRQNCRVM